MSTISDFKLEGLVPATFTPMDENGDVDCSKLEAYCSYLTDNDMSQVFVNGTTGEGFSLTLEERKMVAKKWIELRDTSERLKTVVVHVGTLNLHDTQELARHAASIGADAISAVPPLFFKPKTNAFLIQYCKDVASAAPELPFYYYHLPVATGVEPSIEDFLTEARTEIPTLVGVKYSSKDLVDCIGGIHVTAPHRTSGRFNLLYGCDEKLMAGLVTGADGGVGATYNFMPAVVGRTLRNTLAGNLTQARADQYRVQQTCRIMYKYGDLLGNNVAALKAIMPMVGLDLGPPRSPLRPPTVDEVAAYRRELEAIGFFDWYQ